MKNYRITQIHWKIVKNQIESDDYMEPHIKPQEKNCSIKFIFSDKEGYHIKKDEPTIMNLTSDQLKDAKVRLLIDQFYRLMASWAIDHQIGHIIKRKKQNDFL
jgi:hypothetical protein